MWMKNALIGLCRTVALALGMLVILRDEPILFKVNLQPTAVRPRSYCIANPL